MNAEQRIVDALADRARKLLECPILNGTRRGSASVCPKCDATTRGPCWLNVEADAAFVDTIKEIVA